MKNLIRKDHCSLYALNEGERVLVASTPESRQICNDPRILGVEYTNLLRTACRRVLETWDFGLRENRVNVVHLLRGGLNFGLREALAEAYSWNTHSSTFLSAQRRRQSSDPEQWEISESDYKKLVIPESAQFVFGDVVASGASLRYGLETLCQHLESQQKSPESIVFFTIGGPRTEEMFHAMGSRLQALNPDFKGFTVVYLEGRFPVAERETPLQIKHTGTDLLRWGEDMAPEFVESQYENPMFPVERCTIYDAGSRAFHAQAYLDDVVEYWEQVGQLESSFSQYLKERAPHLDSSRFAVDSLKTLASRQIENLRRL